MKALANSFIKQVFIGTPAMCHVLPDQSSGCLSDFLSFLAIVILNCSVFLTQISFCFTSLCLNSCCLRLEHAFPTCLANSCSSFQPLFRYSLLGEAPCAPWLCPSRVRFACWAPWHLPHHTYHIIVTGSVSISTADPSEEGQYLTHFCFCSS